MKLNKKNLVGILIGIAALALGFYLLAVPEQRTTGEKIGDAVDRLEQGVDDAARELEDRTPAQRIADEIEDATDGDPN